MPSLLELSFGSGLVETAAQLAVIAGTVVLLLLLVALGTFAYKSLRGDGITWPDEMDAEDDDGDTTVRQASDDDWKYY